MRFHRATLALVLALVACGEGPATSESSSGISSPEAPPPSGSSTPPATPPGDDPGVVPPAAPAPMNVTALQKKKAEMLTSIWENGTTVLQYRYSENIGDGRGYTSGRAGFCTGTGDAILVVKCYGKTVTGAANKMAKYLPALEAITKRFNDTGQSQASTKELDAVGNWNADWASSAANAAFNACQDNIVDQFYYTPSVAIAKKWGVTSALSLAAIYDASINHGPDGAEEFAAYANKQTGNTAQKPAAAPLTRDQESAWLKSFLEKRVTVLGADASWRESVDRVATYEQARRSSNFDFAASIVTDAKAKTLYPGKGFVDSGYPKCTIDAAGKVTGDADCTQP